MDELVLIGGEAYRKQLEANLISSKRFICYSAFFTQTAAQWVSKARNFVAEDRLLIRALPTDFSAGSCSFEAIRLVQKHGLIVKMSSALHAKIYAFDDCVYAGSANLTAKGLALSEKHNQELGVRSKLSAEDLDLLDNLWDQGVLLDEKTLVKMENYLNNLTSLTSVVNNLPMSWPSDVIEEKRNLYCSDFPQEYPSNDIRWVSKKSLEQTMAYEWLRSTIKNNGEVSFGFLSSNLHDIIYDDPKPYRRDIKTLLSSLLSIITNLDDTTLEVIRPRHRQLVRFR